MARETVLSSGGIDLTKKFDKSGIALSKIGADGVRAEAVLILDHSGSMGYGYRSGMVQTLVDRALAFALQVDSDGVIPVMPFDSILWPTVDVRLDNYAGVVNRSIFKPSQMGGTRLALALRAVLEMARDATSPIFLTIVTDDDPQDAAEVMTLLKQLKRYAVFIKVLTLVPAPFWDSMDNLDVPGLIDNLDAKRIENPAGMTDLAFAEAMVDEWDSWMRLALQAGILRA
ncbi:VWA domain-containing protein [Nocardia salmonicida]|uniref:VWA domain-containing protein n=1 Tax=Nocardia salmonicida TaxID=53431 RepID=UPI0033CDD490